MSEDINKTYEAPQTVEEDESITRRILPKGTTINKKNVLICVMAVFAALALALVFSFSPRTPKVNPNDLDNQAQTEMANPEGLTSNQLAQVPSSYRDVAAIKSDQLQNQTYANDGYNVPQPPNLTAADIAVPPQIEPVVVSDAVLSENDTEKARKGQIRMLGSNQQVSQNTDPVLSNSNKENSQNDAAAEAYAALANQNQNLDPNGQSNKVKFAAQNHSSKIYANSTLQKPLSKYEVKAGTVIPAVLITGVNSDLPGKLICQVRENVYDSVTGRYLLIPQGSKVIGTYDSQITYGQNRVLVVWTRLILPNGKSIDLESMAGVDQAGYSGLRDKVNNHFWKIAGGVILASGLSYGAQKATEDASEEDPWAQALAENVVSAGSKVTERALNVQPTIVIRPGRRFNLFVHLDFILEPYR
jgi:type IV secretory pathway VirB10-like protein